MALNPTSNQQDLKKIYWALKDEKWREAIDWDYQKFGKRVFDEGLHGRYVEPGFLAGVENACAVVSDHLGQPTTAELYLKVHRIACSHFIPSSRSGIIVGPGEIGKFMRPNRILVYSPDRYVPDEVITQFQDEEYGNFDSSSSRFIYQMMRPETIEKKFNQILKRFYDELSPASNDDAKLHAIARFTKHEQWLHPVPDGCGRVGLLFLNKHLTENGFHPVILDYPFNSSIMTHDGWVNNIKKGLKTWEEFLPKSAESF